MIDTPTRPAVITDYYRQYWVMYRTQGQLWQLYPSGSDTQEDARLLTMRIRNEHPGVNIDTLVVEKVDEWTTLNSIERR